MSQFQVGDTVICTRSFGKAIVEGAPYAVSKVDGTWIALLGVDSAHASGCGWHESRFVLHPELATLRAVARKEEIQPVEAFPAHVDEADELAMHVLMDVEAGTPGKWVPPHELHRLARIVRSWREAERQANAANRGAK